MTRSEEDNAMDKRDTSVGTALDDSFTFDDVTRTTNDAAETAREDVVAATVGDGATVNTREFDADQLQVTRAAWLSTVTAVLDYEFVRECGKLAYCEQLVSALGFRGEEGRKELFRQAIQELERLWPGHVFVRMAQEKQVKGP